MAVPAIDSRSGEFRAGQSLAFRRGEEVRDEALLRRCWPAVRSGLGAPGRLSPRTGSCGGKRLGALSRQADQPARTLEVPGLPIRPRRRAVPQESARICCAPACRARPFYRPLLLGLTGRGCHTQPPVQFRILAPTGSWQHAEVAQIEVTEDVIRDRAGEAVDGQRVSVHARWARAWREASGTSWLSCNEAGWDTLSATMAGVR